MRSRLNRPLGALAALLGLVAPALAQGAPEADPAARLTPGERVDLVVILGAGAEAAPAFEGSDELVVSPVPIVSLEFLSVPGLFTIGGGEVEGGLSFAPSFRSIDERDESDDSDLDGLDSIDATYALGLKTAYEIALDPSFGVEIYGAGRLAFGGADGFDGDLGVDAVWRPTNALELKAGPLATLASGEYMDTYFGVSAEESLDSDGRFDAFEADGGFKSVGVRTSARYEFATDYFLSGSAEYGRLVGDAADSPVVEVAGDEDQVFLGLGLSKRFSLDLF